MRRRTPKPIEQEPLQAHLTQSERRTGWDLVETNRLILSYDVLVDPPSTESDDEGRLRPSDPFRDEVVRCMSSELQCEKWLEPKSWSAAKPHLELVCTIGRDNVLRVEARPWLHFKDPNSGLKVDGRSDYGRLRSGGRPESIEVVRFDLASLGGSTEPSDLEHDAKVLALQRKIVHRLYERAVTCLSRLFVTRVHSGLICFGPSNELAVRESPRVDEVEIANLLSDRSSDWHLTLPKLCSRLGVRVDEALGLFRTRLIDLPLEKQIQTLLEFSGRSYRSGYDMSLPTQLVCALGAVCGSAGRSPLRPCDDASKRALETMAKSGHRSLIDDLLNLYGLDETDAWSVVRIAHPELYRRIDRPARRWRLEFEAVASGLHDAWETPGEMSRRMVLQLQSEASTAAKRWDVQLRRVAATMDMDPDALKKWGRTYAPAVAEWVEHMVSTKGGTVGKRRGRAST